MIRSFCDDRLVQQAERELWLRRGDDGISWADVSGTIAAPVYSLATAGDTLYAATTTSVYYTNDAGLTWTLIPGNGLTSPSIHALMVTGGYIYAGMTGFGSTGAYRRPVPGVTSVELTDETLPRGFELRQNYPNPFNPSTIITLAIGESESVTLKVFDVLGREVVTLVDERLSPGTYTVRFNAGGLASGVYLYRLRAGQFSSTGKMLLER